MADFKCHTSDSAGPAPRFTGENGYDVDDPNTPKLRERVRPRTQSSTGVSYRRIISPKQSETLKYLPSCFLLRLLEEGAFRKTGENTLKTEYIEESTLNITSSLNPEKKSPGNLVIYKTKFKILAGCLSSS